MTSELGHKSANKDASSGGSRTRSRVVPSNAPVKSPAMLALQRTLGNRTVSRLLQPAGPQGADPTQLSLAPPKPVPIAAKATDPLEGVLRTSGQSLSDPERNEMERRFGEDFSGVRVHSDRRAASSAQALQAQAYTIGEHIVFNKNRYAPRRDAGRGLLAHELAHVVQQRLAGGAFAGEKEAERDAGDAAHQVTHGGTPRVLARSAPGVVHRAPLQPVEADYENGTGWGNNAGTIDWTITADGASVFKALAVPGADRPKPRAWEDPGTKTLYVDPGTNGSVALIGNGRWERVLITHGAPSPRPVTPVAPAPKPKPPKPKPKPAQTPPVIVLPETTIAADGPADEPAAVPPAPDLPAPGPESVAHPQTPVQAPVQAEVQPAPRELAAVPDTGSGADSVSQGPLADVAPGLGREDRSGESANSDVPQLSPNLAGRLSKIQSNLKSFTFNPSWRQDIVDSFKGLSPADFQQLQERLGEERMNQVFDQLEPFLATMVGTLGPVTKGKSKLNEKRVEFILDTKDWGAAKETFYRWTFDAMPVAEIRPILQRLAADKRLQDTVLSVPGLAENLKKRGVEDAALTEPDTTGYEGVKRGLERFWTGAWSRTIFASGPGSEYSYLPKAYQDLYLQNLAQGWQKAATPGNIARESASNVTLGLSDLPFGIYETGKAGFEAGFDFGSGKTGQGTEKLTPVVLTILTMLVGGKVGKLGAGAALEESALLGPKRAAPGGGGPLNWEVRPLGKTASGLDRYMARHVSGEFVELVVDQEKKTIQATHAATGKTVFYENGQFAPGPAGLLPAKGGGGLVVDPLSPPGKLNVIEPAPGMNAPPDSLLPSPAPRVLDPLPTTGTGRPLLLPPAGGPVTPLPAEPALQAGPGPAIGRSLPSGPKQTSAPAPHVETSAALPSGPAPPTLRSALGDRRVVETTDALAAATREAALSRAQVTAAQADLDAAHQLATEAGMSADARALVKQAEADLRRAQTQLKPLERSELAASQELAAATGGRDKLAKLHSEVASLDSQITAVLHPPGGRSLGQVPPTSQPRGAAYQQLVSQRDAKLALIKSETEGLTRSLSEQVAAATPGRGARPDALRNAASLPAALNPVNGVPKDVTTGQPMKTGDWATDHIVSRTEIASDPRFARLSPLQRDAMLLEVPENYLPLTREANSSKGTLTIDQWISARESSGKPLPQDVAAALREADRRARAAIDSLFSKYLSK